MPSNTIIKWNVGLAFRDPRPTVQITGMARKGSLADLMQRGVIKSAWGDESDDAVIYGKDPLTYSREEEEAIRRKIEDDRQRVLNAAIEAQQAEKERKELAALEALAKDQAMRDELAMLEGFGSF